jgi:acyl-CoA synthetase (AMP-forming)/AMP-acid ligase II
VPDGEGSQLVEAAVILKKEMPVTEAILRTEVATRVPPYAVPHRILLLEEFPRTGTGKIDRRALQEQALNGKA